MRYIIILLFFFGRGRVTHTVRVFIWRPGRRTAPVMIPNAFRFLIEVLFYLARRSPRLRFSYSFTARPVFVSTSFIVRNEIDFTDKPSVLMKTWVCSALLNRTLKIKATYWQPLTLPHLGLSNRIVGSLCAATTFMNIGRRRLQT